MKRAARSGLKSSGIKLPNRVYCTRYDWARDCRLIDDRGISILDAVQEIPSCERRNAKQGVVPVSNHDGDFLFNCSSSHLVFALQTFTGSEPLAPTKASPLATPDPLSARILVYGALKASATRASGKNQTSLRGKDQER